MVARAEAVAEREITGLLAQPDFQELVLALEELQGLPEEERLRRLERHAWCVLEMALADSDWRAAAFVADQLRRGFNPARMLAKGVLKAQARAAAPEQVQALPPPRSHSRSRRFTAAPRTPALRRRGHRDAVAPPPACALLSPAETALVQTCDRPARAQATPPAATSEPLVLPRARRPDALAARLRGGTAARAAPTTDTDPRGLLRAWAQGP